MASTPTASQTHPLSPSTANVRGAGGTGAWPRSAPDGRREFLRRVERVRVELRWRRRHGAT